MSYDPINVLWIEDNPLQGGITSSSINEREQRPIFDDDLANTVVPAISFQQYPDYFKFFRLHVLQHPEEIKEYISACLAIEDKKGPRELGLTEGAVPELVIFDYKLRENIELRGDADAVDSTKSVKYSSRVKAIREFINPIFKIYRSHGDMFVDRVPFFENEITSYSIEDFIRKLNLNPSLTTKDDTTVKDIKELENDQLGLFAGVEISRMFRNHACVAVPATFNNSDVSKMHVFSKFYEWMNEYDLGTMFSAEQRRDKKWDIIIPHAVQQLRIRIEAQIKTGKITPSYGLLVRLSQPDSSEAEVFSFVSAYGERQLPLDGLFIDEPEETRKQRIGEWCETLLQNLPTSNADLKKAIEVSDHLWETYREKFVDRIDLSDYAFREPKGLLNADEQKKFASLKERYCEKDTDAIKIEYSIQESFEGSKADVSTIRLAVLHLATKAAIEMSKCSSFATADSAYVELSKYEYFNVLFPFVNLKDALLLPMHALAKWDWLTQPGRRWFETNISLEKSRVTRSNCFEFDSWITNGEKTLLRAFFYDEREFLPKWLTP